jgi:hypothetical protein
VEKETLINQLIFEGESTALDFKEEQYPFEDTSDEEKSELLKDILAFVNSFRRVDAYILIGFRKSSGQKAKILGINKSLDDASIQQFVNSKTQKPIKFSYEELEYKGFRVAIISIPLQQRPIYLKKDFGKLKKDTVYYRLGSSTAIADPAVIAEMGRDEIIDKVKSPQLSIEFFNRKSGESLGNEISLGIILFKIPKKEEIPNYPSQKQLYWRPMQYNEDYYRDLANYYFLIGRTQEIGFRIKNFGNSVANSVRLEVKISDESGRFIFFDEESFPDEPSTDFLTRKITTVFDHKDQDIFVSKRGNEWLIHGEFGKIQPKRLAELKSPFYMGAHQDDLLQFEALVFSEDLDNPTSQIFKVEFKTEQRDISLEKIIWGK